jgi:xanthine dehydrogenase YagR molybdenum-binding subunit
MDGGARIGQPQIRIDGVDKVTGRALYPSDEAVAKPAWAFLLTSAIARGQVKGFDLDEALAVPGVLDILTHFNVGCEAQPPEQQSGGKSTTTLQSLRVWHDGQIIGVVVAETYEIAREAAFRVRVHYEREEPSATFDCRGVEEERREPGEHEDYCIGDAEAALASAEIVIDQRYETATQHHNPIELFTTTAEWRNGKLTIWEPSQFVYGLRGNVAQQLDLDPGDVHVISKYIGGAFGSKGGATSRTAWICIASRRIGRPVKLVATRDQGFTIVTYRAETRHRLRLGAGRDGRLTALSHEGWELTSRPSDYNVSGTETTARIYACPNIVTRVNLVHADRNTPGFMRAPPDTPYMFALEVAMDELAVTLGKDPIALRRINDTQTDPVNGKPYSSRHLMDCFDQAAERFGWARRDPKPESMRDGDWQIGWGCATACYPSNMSATAARVILRPDGHCRVQLAGHDIGTGAYTVVAIVAAERLGLEARHVDVELGDTELPPAPLAAGSSHTASISHAVAKACEQLRSRLAEAATRSSEGPFAGQDPDALVLRNGHLCGAFGASEPLEQAVKRLTSGALEAYAENIPDELPPDSVDKSFNGKLPMLRGHHRKHVTSYAFGAQFAEVRVHRLTREIRVPRMVGAFACGTIVNPITAHSQLVGGMIWGLGCALEEKTEIDLRRARYVNDNIAEYHIPVNADVGTVEVIIVPEEDREVNPLGIKGIGEVGIVGMNAAIANAIWHATSRRIRHFPIRIEDLL